MEQQIFELARDFYTLKAEYEMNMKQIERVTTRLTQDNERLRKSFNELRDSFAEHVEHSGK